MYSYKTVCILEKSLNVTTVNIKHTHTINKTRQSLQLISQLLDFYKQQPVDSKFKNLIFVNTCTVYESQALLENVSLSDDVLIKNVPDTNIFFIKHVHAILLAELEHLTGASTLLHIQIINKDFLHNKLDILQHLFKNAF
jgi:hypothetical protein